MDIKENFYSKLEHIREDYDMKKVKDAEDTNAIQKRYRSKDATPLEKKLANKLTKKVSKIKKKAVTGLDEEQLNELRGKGKVDKKEMQAHIRKKHDAAWEKTQEIRKEKKSAGSADTKDMDKYRNRLAKMHNKLDEEQIDELSDPTHMSYRAKARNQMDKMVNRLGSKMGSDTVNTKKLKNRADGIKRSYKLQPKKK